MQENQRKREKFQTKVFLPALVNPAAVRTSGAAATAPTPTTTATPAAFKKRFPKKFTKRNQLVFCNTGENNYFFLNYLCFMKLN